MDSVNVPLLALGEEQGRGGDFVCMPHALRKHLTLGFVTKVMDVFLVALMLACTFYSAYLLVAKEPKSPCKSTSAPTFGQVLTLLIPFIMFFLVLLNSCMVRERAAAWATLLAIEMGYTIVLLGWAVACVFGAPGLLVLNIFGALMGIYLCVCLMKYAKVLEFIKARLFPRGEGVQ